MLSEELFSSLPRPARGKPLKLLSVLLQVALYGMQLIRSGWTKSSPIIDKDDLRILNMHDHIRVMPAAHIDETQGDRDQIIVVPIQLGPDVDTRLRGIPTWQFDDFDSPMQIERDEMARIARRVVMADHGIGLKRSRC